MFPFGYSGEISFQATDTEQDLIPDNPLLEAVNQAVSAPAAAGGRRKGRGRGRGRGRPTDPKACAADTSIVASGANDVGMVDLPGHDCDKAKMAKKMVHRDIERQRRNEMSSLFSNLRSLLPSQYVQGKRSMSDHVTESVNYIKDLQNNIKVLADKRDGLRLSQRGSSSEGSSSSINGCSIQIYHNPVGLQVEIITCQGTHGFALSTTLKLLREEFGLDVVSCVSNTADGNFFHHNIQCQVDETTSDCVDAQHLKKRLYDAITS